MSQVASTIGTKRSHAALTSSAKSLTKPADASSVSLSGLTPLSPPSSPTSPLSGPPFVRSASSLRLIRSRIPYLYDFFYEFSMDWPFYTMCWGLPLPPTSVAFTALSASDRRHYMMQRLYYAQATDASYDPYWGRFVGHPHVLVQAEMPLPSVACVADMTSAASGDPVVLEDVYCSYVTDHRKVAHPGEINRIRLLQQRPDVVLTHTDSPRVYVWDFERQPTKAVKLNCRPHVPDVQLLGHDEAGDPANPLYFALDTAAAEPRVISGGPDQRVCLWALEDYATSLAAPVLAGSADGVARVGAGSLLQARGVYAGHTACVEDVAFHPTSASLFASVGDDQLLFLWDARVEAGATAQLHTGHTDDVNALSWNPVNEHLVLTASSDRLLHLFDLRKTSNAAVSDASALPPGVLHAFAGHEREVKNVSWAPDGVHFASGGDDALIAIWSLQHMQQPPAGGASQCSPLHRAFYRSLTDGFDPCLVFRHAVHPSAVQCLQWNAYHSPGFTLASIHGDTGGQMQIWRINEQLHQDVERSNAETKHWRRQHKREEHGNREKGKAAHAAASDDHDVHADAR